MRDRAWKALPWLALTLAVGIGFLLIESGSEETVVEAPGEIVAPDRSTPAEGESAGPADQNPLAGGEGRAGEGLRPPDPAEDRDRLSAGAEAVYRDYIEAINGSDGPLLCTLLGEEAVEALDLPVEGGGCAGGLAESIGYADPRGFPVWEGTSLASIDLVTVEAGMRARITATIVTTFADRDEPSIESDIAYLERMGGDWRFVKPSAPIYRAIGKPDVPPSVIAAP